MVFIINGKKYDTEKMDKIANVKKWYKLDSWVLQEMFGRHDLGREYNCELWRTKNGNWLLTSSRDYNKTIGEAIDEDEAQKLLMKYDLETYEKLFGEIKEA